jgi:hypothetical protein
MSATVLRSRVLSRTEIEFAVQQLGQLNGHISVEPSFNRDGELEDTPVYIQPIPIENFDPELCSGLIAWEYFGKKRFGQEIADDILYYQELIQQSVQLGFSISPEILLWDQSEGMFWKISSSQMKCGKEIPGRLEFYLFDENSLGSVAQRASWLTDLFRTLGDRLKLKFGTFESDGSFVKYNGKTEQLYIVDGLKEDPREGSMVRLEFKKKEFEPIVESMGSIWERDKFSARVNFRGAHVYEEYIKWCRNWSAPDGYYRLLANGQLKRSIYPRYKSLLLKKKFDSKKPELSGFLPLYHIDIFNNKGQHMGAAKSSLFLDRDEGYLCLAGDNDTQDEQLMECVTLASLSDLFEGESVVVG